MVLAIGIVVDDAIVVVENVERIMTEEGLSPRDATRKAMGQIVNAIIAITVVLSAVFVPMAFFGGSAGAIYRQFAVTLVLTMVFSALMALTLTPALCATLLKHEPGREMMPIDRLLRLVQPLLRRDHARLYRLAWRACSASPGAGWWSTRASSPPPAGCSCKLPGSFLPNEDQGYFLSIVQLPPGATRERTLEVLSTSRAALSQADGSRARHRRRRLLLLRPRPERRHRLRPPQGLGRAPGQGTAAPSALVQRANMAFFRIKQAMVFAINAPPIPELAAVGGFDFRLQDRGGLGRDKLLEARNMALGHGRPGSSAGRRAPGRPGSRAPGLPRYRPRQGASAGHRPRRPQRHPAGGAGRRLHQRLRAPGPHPARADAGRGRHAHARRGHRCACR